MKEHNFAKLTIIALVAVQFLNVEVAHAKIPKSIVHTLKTSDQQAIKDPYFQLKSFSIKELSPEEALEFELSEDIVVESKLPEISNKAFTVPNIPPVPPIPPSDTGLMATTPNGPVPSVTGTLDTIILVVDKLIAIGQKIIPIIKSGAAIVTNNPMTSVSVLPRTDAKDPVLHDMGGWSVPVSKHYKITYVNGFGSEVVSFVYSVTFQHSGSMDGKGKYLAGIRAAARNITISWGFDLNASSQLLQISNVGTQANPIAGATLEMSYTVGNWTRTITTSESFHVTCDGRLYKLD